MAEELGTTTWIQRLLILWAGVLIGGSLIAAPTKFQVEDLTLPVALQVGRVQFQGVLIAELACMAAIIVLLAASKAAWRTPFLATIALAFALLGIQHLAMMPILQARSEQIIAGEKSLKLYCTWFMYCWKSGKSSLSLSEAAFALAANRFNTSLSVVGRQHTHRIVGIRKTAAMTTSVSKTSAARVAGVSIRHNEIAVSMTTIPTTLYRTSADTLYCSRQTRSVRPTIGHRNTEACSLGETLNKQ